MLKKVLLAMLVIVVATRSADFQITRSTTIAAPAAVVFAQVNAHHFWDAWSPSRRAGNKAHSPTPPGKPTFKANAAGFAMAGPAGDFAAEGSPEAVSRCTG